MMVAPTPARATPRRAIPPPPRPPFKPLPDPAIPPRADAPSVAQLSNSLIVLMFVFDVSHYPHSHPHCLTLASSIASTVMPASSRRSVGVRA